MAQFTAHLERTGLAVYAGCALLAHPGCLCQKDQAANWIIATYQQLSGKRPTTLGLGDRPTDAPLLEVMDYAVIVKRLNREGVRA